MANALRNRCVPVLSLKSEKEEQRWGADGALYIAKVALNLITMTFSIWMHFGMDSVKCIRYPETSLKCDAAAMIWVQSPAN